MYHLSLDPKDFFDPIEGEPLRDLLGALQNANIKSNQREANAKLGEISSLLSRQQAELSRQSNLPPCPYCGGRLEGHYEICKHCRSGISWVEGYPCKPGNEAELKRQIDEAKKRLRDERAKEEERARAETERKAKEWEVLYEDSMWVILFICIFILFFVGLSQLPSSLLDIQIDIKKTEQKPNAINIDKIDSGQDSNILIGNEEKEVNSTVNKEVNPTVEKEENEPSLTIDEKFVWVSGVTRITSDFAKIIAKHDKPLRLNSLKFLSPEVAQELANHNGEIYLEKLESLDIETARYLSRHKGKIYLEQELADILSKASDRFQKGIEQNNMDREGSKIRDDAFEQKKLYIQRIFGSSWPKPIKYPEPLKAVTIPGAKKERLIPYYIGMRNRNIKDLIEARNTSPRMADTSLIKYILESNEYLGLQDDDFRPLDTLPDFS